MRVISQDGTMDVPYEISSFSMAVGKYENVEHAVIFCYNYSTSIGTKIAEYCSKEKAKKAMEMLRIAYENNEFYHHTANSELFTEFAKALGEEMFKKFTSEYFQFPAEEELE